MPATVLTLPSTRFDGSIGHPAVRKPITPWPAATVLDHGVRHLEGIGAAGELRLQLVEVAEVDDDRTEHVGASAMDVKHDHVGGRDVLEFDVDEARLRSFVNRTFP